MEVWFAEKTYMALAVQAVVGATALLTLVELLFSLPVSNGKVEQVFSQVNVIKFNQRTQPSNEALDDFLIVTTAGDPLDKFNPDHTITRWWKHKVCQPNQKQIAPYKKRQVTTHTGGSTSAEAHDSIESEHSSDTESNSDPESESILQNQDSWINIRSD